MTSASNPRQEDPDDQIWQQVKKPAFAGLEGYRKRKKKMELLLSDEEAQYLISIIKNIVPQQPHVLEKTARGQISIEAKEVKHEFILYYMFALDNIHLNFADARTHHTLVRINLDQKFHKNSDGHKVRGNRVEIFSAEEFIKKGDGYTHYKAYPLPFETIRNTNDFFEAIDDILNYTHTNKGNKTIFVHNTTLL